VPYKLGFPLGEPHNAELQHKIIGTALNLYQFENTPLIETF
jgi:hypothetical protein